MLFVASLTFHALLVLAFVSLSVWAVTFPDIPPAQQLLYSMIDVQTPPPAPPPAPPPPKASRQIAPVEPVPEFHEEMAPTMIPDLALSAVLQGDEDSEGDDQGVEGGVEGGVAGGVIGGSLHGVVGGTVGGVASEHQPGDAVVVARDANLPMKALSRVFPDYPDGARVRGIEGSVLVRYIIDKTGRVREVTVLQAAHKLLTQESVRCIRSWRFRPLIVDGEPVEVVHELTVIFQLVTGH